MSDVPMHPQPPSHGDDPYGQQNPADPNGAPQDGAYGAHQEDQSWLLDDGPDPVLEPLPYEAVQALPEDLAEPAMEEEDDWLASRAEEDLTGEPMVADDAPAESAYVADETYVPEEESLVGASYVEPEPKSRPFTRALMPGVAALLVSFGGIALWSSLKNPMGLDSDVEMTQVESDREGGPGVRTNVELAAPSGGRTKAGATGRMSVNEDGSVNRPVAGVSAPSIGAGSTPTVDSPREPGELPEDVGPTLPPQDVAVSDATDDDDFAGGTFDAAESSEPMGDDFDVASLEDAFGDLDDWVPPGDEPVAVAEIPESADAPAFDESTGDEALVADAEDTASDEPTSDDWTDETLVADETGTETPASDDDWAEGDWTDTGDEPADDWAAWAEESSDIADATDVPVEDAPEVETGEDAVTPELDFDDFVNDSETVADATEPAEELDPLARALENFENGTVTVVAVEPEDEVESSDATEEPAMGEDETLASVTTEIPAEDVSTTFDIEPADEPDGLPVFGPDVETTAPVAAAEPEFGPADPAPFDVAVAEDTTDELAVEDTNWDETFAEPDTEPTADETEVAVADETPDAFRLEESEAHARLDEIFGDLDGEDFVVESTPSTPTTVEVTPEISDPFPAPPPGAGAEVDLGPPSGPESVAAADVETTSVEDPTPGTDGPVTDRVVLTPAGPDPEATTDTAMADATDADVVGPQPAPADPTPEVATADPLVPNTGGPVEPDAPQYPGADASAGPDGQRFVEKDPVDVEVRSSLAGEGTTKKRGGILTQVDEDAYWPHKSVPKRKFDNKAMVLTPNVGNVRVVFNGGESIDGRLHAVGQQRLVLDTKMGRMSVDARRAERVDRISGVSAKSLRAPSKTGSTSGLKRVRVRAKGGTFYGHLVAQEGNKVTLLLDEGFRLTVESTDITEMGGKSGSRLRRMDDKKK